MKALATKCTGSVDAKLIEVPKSGDLKPHEVLIKTISAGICGTDFDVMFGGHGNMPAGLDYLILGHEAIGIVEEVGKLVREFKTGDFVVPTVRRPKITELMPNGCECPACGEERFDYCLTGEFFERGISGIHGFFSEYFIEEDRFLVEVRKEEAGIAVLAEPMSIVEKAIEVYDGSLSRLPYYRPGFHSMGEFCTKALVLGIGTIGQLAVQRIKLEGIDVYAAAANSPLSQPAKIVKDSVKEYVQISEKETKNLDSLVGDIGQFDLIIEATGSIKPIFYAISKKYLAQNGVIVALGLGRQPIDVTTDGTALLNSLVLANQSILGSVNSSKTHFEKALETLSSAKDAAEKIITDGYNINNFENAIKCYETNPDRIKVVLTFP